MVLPQLAEQYLAGRFVSKRYAQELRNIAKRLQHFSGNGHLPTCQEAIAWLQSLDVSPGSINSYRTKLLVLYHWLYQRGYLEQKPSIPRARPIKRMPEAWTAEEVGKLLAVARNWPGNVGRHAAAKRWPARIHAVYWTGARIGSVMEATPADFDADKGVLVLRKTKNSRERGYRLHPVAVAAIREIYSPAADRLFVWPHCYTNLFKEFRRLVRQAGIRYTPGKRFQLFHRLRRTTITYCWIADPALAQRQADHSSAEITKNHYVDPLIAQQAQSAVDVLPVPEQVRQLTLPFSD